MKPRFVFAASILLLTLKLAGVQAVASDSTNCSQKPPAQASAAGEPPFANG